MSQCKIILVVIISLTYLSNYVSAACIHGELLPNPTDCQLFYQCSHGTLYEHTCPSGLHFNTKIDVCDYPSNVDCERSTTPETTSSDTTTPDNVTQSPKCNCGERYPNTVDCQRFYRCFEGILYEDSCPEGLNFNSNRKVCDYPSHVKCENISSPIPTTEQSTTESATFPITEPTTPRPTPPINPTTTSSTSTPTDTTTSTDSLPTESTTTTDPIVETTTTDTTEWSRTTTPRPTDPTTSTATDTITSIEFLPTELIPFSLSSCNDFCGRYVGDIATCPQFDIGMKWSSAGPIPGKYCTQIVEIDPDSWHDNYLCFNNDYGVKWGAAGPYTDMNCERILEPADPHTWDDNFLCVPYGSAFQFKWSHNGTIPGLCCEQMIETKDQHAWDDNFICVSE